MTFDEFTKHIIEITYSVKRAIEVDICLRVESAALKFVDDNFRNQGWEGGAWQPSEGTILVKSGDLRRGFESEASLSQVRIFNPVKYAIVHNQGFQGDVTIPEHERGQYQEVSFKRKGTVKKTGSIRVKSHSKKMNVPKRQFAPYEGNESQTLNATVITIIETETLKRMQP